MNSSKKARAFALFTAWMFVVASAIPLSAVPAMAQAVTGTLRGTVADANGSVVAGATVSAKNEATGSVTPTSTTTAEGAFEFAGLTPGAYTVSVEAAGFKRSVNTAVQVKAGIVNPLDVKLEPGNVAETVTVTSNTEEIVQRDQSQISTTIDARRIQELPSNGAGGGLDTLALLAPGVVNNRVGGTNTNGTGLSVNGNRGRSNNFQIDGEDNNDLSVGGPALFVDFQDSIQEYQIITNNFSAQYGRNQGAVVNIVTKSGTNDFHGSAFEYHQDNKHLNSLDNIQRRSNVAKTQSLYNVFGGTVGGPVYLPHFGEGKGKEFISGKDRLFFFVAYQGVRNPSVATGRSTSLAILPSEFSRLSTTFPNNAVIQTIVTASPFAIPGAALNATSPGTAISSAFNLNAPSGCPRAIAVGATPPSGCGAYTAFVNPTTGQPFLTGGPFDVLNFGSNTAPTLFQAAQYERTAASSFTENYWSMRFDVKASNKDNVSFRYLNQRSVSTHGVGTFSTGFLGDVPASSKNLGGDWTRTITNRMVNEFRASYQKIGVEFGGGCSLSTIGCIPGPQQIGSAFTNIAFPALGVTKTGALAPIGPATNLPQGRIGKVYQLADNLSWTMGKHSFIFGAEYKHLNTIAPFLPNFNGAYQFNSAQRIINNAPSAVAITLGDPTLIFPENDQYYFAQDDFKVRPNLTLNLGVRYEYTGQPINVLHDQTVARESNASTAFFNPSLPLSIRTVPEIPVDKNNFAPRVGFAWSPHFWKGFLGEDATVIRGGFSIAYDAAFYNILLNVQNAAPFSIALNIPVSSLPASGSPAPLPGNPTGDVVRSSAAASGVLPTGKLNPLFLAQTVVAPDFRAPYSEQFSLGVQHQFGRNHVAEVRYVGTHGVALFQNVNGNFFIGPLVNGFTLTRNGLTRNFPSFSSLLPPGTTAQVCVDNPATLDLESACNNRQLRQGGITTRQNSSQSIYHSMQSRYNGRFLKDALSLGLSYTWSKTIDDSSEIFAFADIASPNAQNPFCINRCERGLSNLDRRHAFAANYIFDIPLMKEQRGFVGHVVGGWQLNGTYILTSGQRYTPTEGINGTLGLGATYLTAGDRPFIGNPNADPRQVAINAVDARLLFASAPLPPSNGSGDSVFYSMNSINASGTFVPVSINDVHFIVNGPGAAKFFGTPFGNSPRNTLAWPAINTMNMGLFKNIKVFENLTVQLRGEAFNVLNHPNPGVGVERSAFAPILNVQTAGTPGSAFANDQDIEMAHRVVQVGIRVIF
ncbi:MAG TPA: carboxypeptidase regulatory-like domain-containing protein [Pyrinomonadaceae bacterium]|nr:carboxypeptidase regulatory-like domain-containing protein [Pyrinomonadaceae bacterium]